MKVLQIVESAFRTLVEEQDDTILWLVQNLRCAGADTSVLLTGHACYYALQTRVQPALKLGNWKQTQPANVPRDIANLSGFKVAIYVVKEDLVERGLAERPCHPDVQIIERKDLVSLYESFTQIWQW